MKWPGYGPKDSVPPGATERAANHGRTAGFDGASAACFPPSEAQNPEKSYSSNSTTSPFYPPG